MAEVYQSTAPASIPEGALEEIANRDVKPADQIDRQNTYIDSDTDTIQFRDDAAVKLVIDDTHAADNYININQWASGWTMADLLYQSPITQSSFDGGQVGSAAVPKFTLSNHISAIVPKMMGGLFYEDPPFLLRPRPGVTQDIIEAKTALFAAQLGAMDFEIEVGRFLNQMALLGTSTMKWGYTEYQKKFKKRIRKGAKKTLPPAGGVGTSTEVDTTESDDFTIEYYEKTISHPWIKWCDLRTVLVNPGARVGDIRKSGWTVYRDFATYSDLDKLRQQPGYNIPDEETLRYMFETVNAGMPDNISMTIPEGMLGYLQHARPRSFRDSSDPTRHPMEILERWDDERVIVILCYNDHNILIRNEPNPYGRIPFFSANWRDIPDSFYGQGLGLLIGTEQIVEQGVTNLALDLLNYGLQPTAVRKKGFNTPTQNVRWRQGGIIDVEEDVDKAFKFLEMPPVPAEAWQFIQQAQVAAAASSGANEQVVQGASSQGIRTSGMRSGTGAAAVVQANASRLDDPESRFINQVFVPWLYQMDELNNDLLPTSVLKQVLGDELGDKYKNVDHIDFRNAKIEYEVLAGAHLGVKKSMEQALPFILQLMNNPTFTQNANDHGYTWDGPAIFKGLVDIAGYKFSQPFLRPMTDSEKERHQANSPAAIAQAQAQNQQGMQQAQFQHEQEMESQKQLGKAGNEAVRGAIAKATQPELTGTEPGAGTFGSNPQY